MISRYVVMARELRQPPCPCYIITTAGRHISVCVPVCSPGDFDMTFHECSGLCPLWKLSTSEESGLGLVTRCAFCVLFICSQILKFSLLMTPSHLEKFYTYIKVLHIYNIRLQTRHLPVRHHGEMYLKQPFGTQILLPLTKVRNEFAY